MNNEALRAKCDELSDRLDLVRQIAEDRSYASRLNQLEAIRKATDLLELPDTKQDETILNLRMDLDNARATLICGHHHSLTFFPPGSAHSTCELCWTKEQLKAVAQ